MKRLMLLLFAAAMLVLSGCRVKTQDYDICASTAPLAQWTTELCHGTPLTVGQLVTENISCLHDYSLSVAQMKTISAAKLLVLNGAGLEDFLANAIPAGKAVINVSTDLELLEGEEHDHGSEQHEHDDCTDPHFWLSPALAGRAAQTLCTKLCAAFPQYSTTIRQNLASLEQKLADIQAYGESMLASLSCRELITFHDGFAYLAQSFGLTILEAVEEESGSEASAKELTHLISLVREHGLPAVFVETNGSAAAADIIRSETGCRVCILDMGISSDDYFATIQHNIDTILEACG